MQGLISNLIRPFRFRYSIFDLGPKSSDKYDRQDSSVLNDRGFRIQYSYYKNKNPSNTCVIYAHCNSGCRVEGLQFVQPVMEEGWNLCLFDFAGSGISQGQFISLGYYECMDLQSIVSVMLKQGNNKIHLWGRSMGAATIILYLSQTKQIDAIVSCVLDSPYSSLWRVVRQFGKSKTKIPEFIIQHVMQYLRKNILKDHQFDIKQLQLVKKIQNIQIPIMFIASTNDSFVDCNHATQLYKLSVSKEKVLEYIQQQHNSPRQSNTFTTGLNFMSKSSAHKYNSHKQLKILSKKKELCRKMTGNNMAQLITKPVKTNQKNQSCSTGNLTKLSNCYLNNIKIIKKSQANTDYQPEKQQNQNLQKPHKNPHTIQQSIIKLAFPPKQILEHTKNIKNKIIKQAHKEQQKVNTIQNRNKQKQNTTQKLSRQKVLRVDKQNNLNASNKSRPIQQQNTNKFFDDIQNFSFNVNKFNYYEGNLQNTIKMQTKQPQQKKRKSQKLNICVKKMPSSLSKQSKPSGIKITNKIKQNYRKQKSTNVSPKNKKYDEQYQSRRERIKTQIVRGSEQDQQSQKQFNKLYKPNKVQNKEHQQKSIYSNISIQEPLREDKKWMCGIDELCKLETVDNNSKQVISCKYRDSQINRNSLMKEKHDESFNQVWGDKTKDFDVSPMLVKTGLKHFHSIGDLPSSTSACNDNKKRGGYIRNHEMAATQKIIKIQLDRNLFQKTAESQQILKPQNIKLDIFNLKHNKNQHQSQQQQSYLEQAQKDTSNFEDNPIFLKFKLKNKRIFKTNSQYANTLML